MATVVLKPDVPHIVAGFCLALVSSAIPDWVQVNIPFIQIKGFEGHRAFSHWLLTALASTLLLYPHLGYDLAVYWLVGYLSHLVLDVVTGYGIYLLGPIPALVGIPLARNGDALERWMNSLAPLVCIAILAVGIILG
jgi:inner membrane protein